MGRLDSGPGSFAEPSIGLGSPTLARTAYSHLRSMARAPVPYQHESSTNLPTLNMDCPIPWPASQETVNSSHVGLSADPRSSTWLARRYYECLWLGENYFPLAEFVMAMDAALERGSEYAKSESSAALLVASIAGLLQSRNQIQTKYRQDLPAKVASLSDIDWESAATSQISAEERQVIRAALQSGPGQLVAHELIASSESQNSQAAPVHKLKEEWLIATERRELSLQVLLVLEALRLSVEFPALLSSKELDAAMQPMLSSSLPSNVGEADPSSHNDESQLVSRDSTRTYLHKSDSQSSVITSQDIFGPSTSLESQEIPLSQQEDSQDLSQLPESQDLSQACESANKPSKKRKRKSMPARRWTGFPTAIGLDGGGSPGGEFPWEKRPSKPGDTGGGMDDDEATDDRHGSLIVRDPEKLHKRLESLVDRLSLRVITADLAKDMGGILDDSGAADPDKDASKETSAVHPGESQSVDRKSAKGIQFGTAARVREDQDEMDELYYLYLIIVEPRFSRTLPRQCSTVRSRAITSVHGSTPVRPKASKSNNSASQVEVTDQQRRREEQQLSKTRKELDLVSKGKTAEVKAKAREERRASQRPALRDALFAEEKEQRKGRSSSIAADAERNKREVSVNRRVGWTRSVSTSQADGSGEAGGVRDSQSQERDPRRSISTTAPFGGGGAFSKRKSLDPQRFGGLFANAKRATGREVPIGTTKTVPLACPIDDNPFLDSSSKPASTGGAPTASSQRIVVTETPRKAKRIRPDLVPPTSTAARPASSWGRTESQPVSSRDLASSSTSVPRRHAANPFHPPASNAPTVAGKSAIRTASTAHLAVPPPHRTEATDGKRRSISRSETCSRATSLAPSEEISVDVDDAASTSSSLTSMGTSDAAASVKQELADDDDDEEEEEEMMFFKSRQPPALQGTTAQARRPLHGLSGISNWVKSSATALLPPIKTQNSEQLQVPTKPIPLIRRPSGRNPFAKSASMQAVKLGE